MMNFGLDTVIYCAPLTPVPVLTLSNGVERVSFECRRHVVSLLFHCDVNVLVLVLLESVIDTADYAVSL